MFNSIVVGFDASPHASRALEISAELAGRLAVPLGIIYVVDASQMSLPEDARKLGEAEHIIEPMPKVLVNFSIAPAAMLDSVAQATAETEKAMFQYADFILGQAQATAREQGVQDIECESVAGDPAEEIVAYARIRGADLIVTGCRGFGKLKSMLLGSTSHQVAQLAECSCLTIK